MTGIMYLNISRKRVMVHNRILPDYTPLEALSAHRTVIV